MPKSYSAPRYHTPDQIIRAIRNALVVALIPLHERQYPRYKKCSMHKESFYPADHTTGNHVFSISTAGSDIFREFSRMYIFRNRNGLSLKFLLEALCSTSSCRHRYRKTSTDIQQRSILSLPRFPLSFPPCAASFLLRQRKWNPVRDAIRATFVPLLDQRYFVLHLESALWPSNTSFAFESADTFSHPTSLSLIFPTKIAFVQSAKK